MSANQSRLSSTNTSTTITTDSSRPARGAIHDRRGVMRARWAAVGAAVAVALGGGGVGLVNATISSGERPVLVSIDPCRLVDTRPTSQIGPRDTPLGADEEYDVVAHGAHGECNIPATASGLSLNVTTLNATAPTNVRVYPADTPLPLVSNLNPNPGQPPAPNAVTTGLDPAGTFSIYNAFGTVDVIVDVNGYYEDHNHDDRYVQLDSLQWAVVEVNGSVVRASDRVAGAQRIDEGYYAVTFDRDISGCAYQATAGRPGVNHNPTPSFAMVANWTGDAAHSVAVFTKLHDGLPHDAGFHLQVTC